MEQGKIKYPRSGGAKRSAERFEKNRKKEPSDRLVNIISEYGKLKTPRKGAGTRLRDFYDKNIRPQGPLSSELREIFKKKNETGSAGLKWKN